MRMQAILPPDRPAAAVEAPEEQTEAGGAERDESAAMDETAEEQVTQAEEHRIDEGKAQYPVEEVVGEGAVGEGILDRVGGRGTRSGSLRYAPPPRAKTARSGRPGTGWQ